MADKEKIKCGRCGSTDIKEYNNIIECQFCGSYIPIKWAAKRVSRDFGRAIKELGKT